MIGAGFPLLAYLATFAIVYRRERDPRASLVISAIVWGVAVVFITETLSFFHWIGTIGIAVAWLAAIVAGLAGVWWSWRGGGPSTKPPSTMGPNGAMLSVCVPLSLVLGILAFVAVTMPPNSDDSMTYHMPRVMHWLQNHSVEHYPTTIQRQLYLAPWSSFAVLQFQALLGNDYLANSVQWFSMIVAVIGVSLIARELGANPAGQLLASALAASTPIAVLQSTTAENHLAVTCWLVCFVWFAFKAIDSTHSKSHLNVFMVLAGLALGLAILTKATAYIIAPPFCLWLAWVLFRRLRMASVLPLILLVLPALALNVPEYVREIRTYGSPLGPGMEQAYLSRDAEPYGNLTHSPGAIVSNLARNTAIELTSPLGPLTSAIEQAVKALHRWMGVDINDPRTTWNFGAFKLLPGGWSNGSFAGNPLQFVLIVLACTFVLFRFRKFSVPVRFYVISLICMWILFSIRLRWNPWLARLHLPIVILGTPLVGLILYQIGGQWTSLAVANIALCLAIPYALMNVDRPLIGPNAYFHLARSSRYFIQTGPGIEKVYSWLVNYAEESSAPCNLVGIKLGRDDPEYAFWIIFRRQGRNPRIEHVDVQNASAKYYSSLAPIKAYVVLIARLSEMEYHAQIYGDIP